MQWDDTKVVKRGNGEVFFFLGRIGWEAQYMVWVDVKIIKESYRRMGWGIGVFATG